MHEYWKTSLFLYEIQEDHTPIVVYWRATAYTFHSGVDFRVLHRILAEYVEGELIEPKDRKVAREKRQVSASDSKGLGFYWVNISRSEQKGHRMLKPDTRVAVFNLSAYEKVDVRLGYSEFLGKAAQYGKDKLFRKAVGRAVESFWEWLTR